MAYNFVQANGSRVALTGSPITASPVTLSAWIRRDTIATGNRSIVRMTAYNDGLILWLNPSNFVVARAEWGSGSNISSANSSGTVSANDWTHAVARFNLSGSTNVLSSYLNGSKGADTSITSFTQETLENGQIGSQGGSTTFGGDIADVGVWNTALSDAEIVSLSKGIACNKVRPQSLRFYAPLIRNLSDIRGGRTLTAINSLTVSNHPRIYA